MKYIIDRLGEESTWRGFVLVLTAVGVVIDPAQSAAISAAGMAVYGLWKAFRPDPN